MADLKDKVREAVDRAQNSEDVLTFAHVEITTSMKEPEPGVFEIGFLPTSLLPKGPTGKVYLPFNP